MSTAWPGRGWRQGQGAVSEGIAILLSAAEKAGANGQFAAEVICLQTATQFGDRSGACGCASSSRSSRDHASVLLPGLPRPCATLTPRNCLRCRRNSSELATLSRPWMRARMPPSRIAAKTCEDRRWDARRARMPLLNNAAASTPALRQASESLPLTDREARS